MFGQIRLEIGDGGVQVPGIHEDAGLEDDRRRPFGFQAQGLVDLLEGQAGLARPVGGGGEGVVGLRHVGVLPGQLAHHPQGAVLVRFTPQHGGHMEDGRPRLGLTGDQGLVGLHGFVDEAVAHQQHAQHPLRLQGSGRQLHPQARRGQGLFRLSRQHRIVAQGGFQVPLAGGQIGHQQLVDELGAQALRRWGARRRCRGLNARSFPGDRRRGASLDGTGAQAQAEKEQDEGFHRASGVTL